MDATAVTYTATDATGRTADLTFNITVAAAPPVAITFTPNVIPNQQFTVNTAITPLLLPEAYRRDGPLYLHPRPASQRITV